MKTSTHNNALLQEGNEPQLSKEGIKSTTKGNKRANKVAPNIILKKEKVGHRNKELQSGRAWKVRSVFHFPRRGE